MDFEFNFEVVIPFSAENFHIDVLFTQPFDEFLFKTKNTGSVEEQSIEVDKLNTQLVRKVKVTPNTGLFGGPINLILKTYLGDQELSYITTQTKQLQKNERGEYVTEYTNYFEALPNLSMGGRFTIKPFVVPGDTGKGSSCMLKMCTKITSESYGWAQRPVGYVMKMVVKKIFDDLVEVVGLWKKELEKEKLSEK